MNWVRDNRKDAFIVSLTVAVPFVLVVFIVVSTWATGHSYQEEIDSLQPRIARLMGAKQAEEQLLTAAQKAESRMQNLVYPSTENPDTVSATLQKNVRGVMSEAGLGVADSRIEPTRREGQFDVIGLTVSVTGTIDSLDAALREIVAYTPLLLVTSLDVTLARTSGRSVSGQQEEQALSVKMHLLALRGVE